MTKNNSLEKRVELADKEGIVDGYNELIIDLYSKGDESALDLLLILCKSSFDGFLLKSELKVIAMLGTLRWGIRGLEKLGNMAITESESRTLRHLTQLLSHISSKSLSDHPYAEHSFPCIKHLNLASDQYKTTDWVTTARKSLIQVAKSSEQDEQFPFGIVNNLNFMTSQNAQRHVFAALMARWFDLDIYGIEEFYRLINGKSLSEQQIHEFLRNNLYILEPFHAQIWSKPRFGEALVPDFCIRSMDDDYTIVEIEKPNMSIMTRNGELSSVATHAKRQALDFRDWIINNRLYAITRFPNIYRPSCLVVIGLESDLSETQLNRLRQENESTQGMLKIVGFDWLYNRSKATLNNIINFGFDRGISKHASD